MKNFKFSKGQWTKMKNDLHNYTNIKCSNREGFVACVYGSDAHTDITPQEAQANLNLVLAAPEMYETLEAVIELFNDPDADGFDAHKMEEKIREVLKKTRGES